VNPRILARVCHPSRIAALVIAATTVLPIGASAQRFPNSGEAVIHAMHDRYESSWYRTLTFIQKTTRRTAGDTMAVETWKEAAIFPGRLRIDVEGKTPQRTYIYSGDSLFVIRGDSVTRLARRNILLIIGFDVYRQSVDKTLADLSAQHVAMTPVRADTWEGREVYVIGAAAGDLHSPQLWIDRDRLLFLRALEPNEQDSTKTDEYRFDNYTLLPDGWLSETVIMSTDGKVMQKEEYRGVQMNARLDAKLFRPPT
jgi:outer membrane lipoprotein-sorting protein